MTYRLGLTGSIGMGKSTTAAMFVEAGIPVWDADAAVARLYSTGGAAVDPVGRLVPGSATQGGLDRDRLRDWIAEDPANLARLEEVVHPLVAKDRAAFLRRHPGAALVVFDIPLLFETGAEAWLDGVAVVTVPAEVQRARVLARPGMTEDRFRTMLDRQMPDAEKRRRADFVIETLALEPARRAVHDLIAKLTEGHDDA